jgi:hypothetical protein
MKIGIVEYGGELNKIFQSEVSKNIETADFQVKKALDLFDVLAFARKMSDLDQLVIIADMEDQEPDVKRVFLQGLATLEEETGKNIFKCLYEDDGEGQVKELAETFFNYLFHPERLEKEKEKENEFPL